MLTKFISRSLLVLACGTVLLAVGKISSMEWIILAGAYLGYNLFGSYVKPQA